MTSIALPPRGILVATRRSWHQIAELVVSPVRQRVNGHVGLRSSPGGFRTPPFGADDRVVRVEGLDVVDATPAGERRRRLTTLRAAGAFVGLDSDHLPDTDLPLDPAAADVLARWFALGAEALDRWSTEIEEDEPSTAQLWPEHFDIGLTAAEINYGASPGDDAIALPYLYVGPHQPPVPGAGFWNAAFGAYRTIEEITSVPDALAFFRAGRDRSRGLERH